MTDVVEKIGEGSVIQHGKHNDRVYLMKLDERDIDTVLTEMPLLSKKHGYSKIFCKVPKHIAPKLFSEGFILEAFIPKFYNHSTDVLFVSKFLDSNRLLNIDRDQLLVLTKLLSDKSKDKTPIKKLASPAYSIRKLDTSDVEQITGIYRDVFKTYPFPIHEPEYIANTMREHIQYFGAEKNGELVALSSAEVDFNGGNAEMTDFATRLAHKGNRLSSLLLKAMEAEMIKQGIKLLYTIARLNSIPMNKTFLKNNYQYSGTLINNTNIAGRIESMNVYYKHC